MLAIRLQRTGRKNLATYRIVVAEHARPVKAKFIEILGYYLPQQKDSTFKVDAEKVQTWIKKGARPSDTVARLLKRNGVKDMEKFIQRYTKQRKTGELPPVAETAPAPAEPAGDSAPAQA